MEYLCLNLYATVDFKLVQHFSHVDPDSPAVLRRGALLAVLAQLAGYSVGQPNRHDHAVFLNTVTANCHR